MKKFELKDCPFCGGSEVGVVDFGSVVGLAHIRCTTCNAQGPYRQSGPAATAFDEAVVAWNGRPGKYVKPGHIEKVDAT